VVDKLKRFGGLDSRTSRRLVGNDKRPRLTSNLAILEKASGLLSVADFGSVWAKPAPCPVARGRSAPAGATSF
jgi:hypothetical protein